MSQLCLMDFKENDSFLKYDWESDWIKAIDLETEEPNKFGISTYRYKKLLQTKRVPTKKGLEFHVVIGFIYEDGDNSFLDEMKEKTEQKAIDTFIGLKEEMEFHKEMNKKGRFFDGRRYFWGLTKEDEPIDRGWN